MEKHELLEFRRIAAYLYQKNKRWAQSVQLSKEVRRARGLPVASVRSCPGAPHPSLSSVPRPWPLAPLQDRMYKDAIDTAAESKDADIAEELLRFFVSVRDRSCFTATLYTCYDLVRPDVALELAWRNGYTDFAMPYMIQYMRHLHEKVYKLEKEMLPEPKDEAASEAAAVANAMYGGVPMMMMNDTLMLTNSAYNGYGAPQGMAPGGIPDPYQQQAMYGQGMGGGYPGAGYPGAGYGGGGY